MSREIGREALRILRDLSVLLPKECFEWNPIKVYEAMVNTNHYAYCPFAYGYANYATPGYAAQTLKFTDTVDLDAAGPLRTTLGGAGLAISAKTKFPERAAEYAAYVASGEVQSREYCRHGGQPAHRAAWLSDETNSRTGDYFLNTLPVLDRAYLRPRYHGYMAFQDNAGAPIREYLMKGVAYITLNRPPANSYQTEMLGEFASLVAEVNRHSAIRVIVLQSANAKFFCAGADIKVFSKNDAEANRRMSQRARTVLAEIINSPKVTIAAIAGHALGGGMELALGCDLRIAAEGDYKLGLPEINLGLIPGNGGTQLLPRLVGSSRAMDILLTGDSLSPQEALRIGLVNRLIERKDFTRFVSEYAGRIASRSGPASAAVKRALREGLGLNLPEALEFEASLAGDFYDSADAGEGMRAYLEKRPPKFRHR